MLSLNCLCLINKDFFSLPEMCQTPAKTAYLQHPSTKIVFNVSSNDTRFKSDLRLHVRFDRSTILEEGTFEDEGFRCSVIYNTCTDSSKPDMVCREAQVTFWGDVPYETVSFHLYRHFSQVRKLSNLTLEHQPTEGKALHKQSHLQHKLYQYSHYWYTVSKCLLAHCTGTQTPATTVSDTTGSTTSDEITKGPGATNAQGNLETASNIETCHIQTQRENCVDFISFPTGAASTKGIPYPIDVIACVLVAVLLVLLVVAVVMLIITCRRRRAQSQSQVKTHVRAPNCNKHTHSSSMHTHTHTTFFTTIL